MRNRGSSRSGDSTKSCLHVEGIALLGPCGLRAFLDSGREPVNRGSLPGVCECRSGGSLSGGAEPVSRLLDSRTTGEAARLLRVVASGRRVGARGVTLGYYQLLRSVIY